MERERTKMGEIKELRSAIHEDYKNRIKLLDNEALFTECCNKLRLYRQNAKKLQNRFKFMRDLLEQECADRKAPYIFNKASIADWERK